MNELLINIYCPSISKSYDFWIPGGLKTGNVVQQVCDAICEVENNDDIFINRESVLLCSYMQQSVLPNDITLDTAGIRSGDRLAVV